MALLDDEALGAAVERLTHAYGDLQWPTDPDDLGALRDDMVAVIEHAAAMNAALRAEQVGHRETQQCLDDAQRALEEAVVLLRKAGLR